MGELDGNIDRCFAEELDLDALACIAGLSKFHFVRSFATTYRTTPAAYLAHREDRLNQVREALRVLGEDATARQIVEHVYTDVDTKLWDAAEKSTQAQLDYLRA